MEVVGMFINVWTKSKNPDKLPFMSQLEQLGLYTFDFEEVHGDTPPGQEILPQEYLLGTPNPKTLIKQAGMRLYRHLWHTDEVDLLTDAQKRGKDVVAYVASHGNVLMIAVGAAALAVVIYNGFVFYKHHREEKEQKALPSPKPLAPTPLPLARRIRER